MIVSECFFRIRRASMGTAFAGRKTATVRREELRPLSPQERRCHMKQTEVGRRYRVHVYYTKYWVRSQAISTQMFGFSVIHKGMNKQMAQNVKDVQIDRIQELAQAQGVSMRYLCELVWKRRRGFFADIRNGKDYTMQVWNIVYNKTLCKKAQAKPDGKDPPGWLFFGAILPWDFSG